jgi:probable HAF family extracellular repeat protein
MTRIALAGCVLTTLAACDGPSRTTQPSRTSDNPAAAAAPQLVARSLGTLGGSSSAGNAINEAGAAVGFSDLASGEVRAFLWRPDRGMQSLGTLITEEEKTE